MIKKTEFGSIEYRYPTIPEALDLLAMMGISASGVSEENRNELRLLSKVIAHMGEMITKVSIEIDGEKLTTYEQVCTKLHLMGSLTEIANELLGVIYGGLEVKKKQSKTP